MDGYLRCGLYLHASVMWLLAAARFLVWCLMTGGLVVGAAWAGRPVVLSEWLASAPPTWRGPGRREVAIALESARGFAAIESWMQAGCPPRADRAGSDRTGEPNASD